LFLALALGNACSTSTTGTQTTVDASADATGDTGLPVIDGSSGNDARSDAQADADTDGAVPVPEDAGDQDAAQDAATNDAATNDAGEDAGSDAAPDAAPSPFVLSSGAFANNGDIPAVYTCSPNGAIHQSPPIAWTGGPVAQSYAVVMVDNDVASPGNVHWVIYDLAPATQSLGANIPHGYQIGAPSARQAKDSFSGGTFGYFYPCPPAGKHTYQFEVFALDVAQLPTAMNTTTAAVIAQISAHKLASTTLLGKYQK
jgi:Raf kinase inhibitor-like YbhB/YbcL family protein